MHCAVDLNKEDSMSELLRVLFLGSIKIIGFLSYRKGRIHDGNCVFAMERERIGSFQKTLIDVAIKQNVKGACVDNHTCVIFSSENRNQILGVWFHDNMVRFGTVTVDHRGPLCIERDVPWRPRMKLEDIIGM